MCVVWNGLALFQSSSSIYPDGLQSRQGLPWRPMRSGTDLENSQSHRSYPQNQKKTMTYWRKNKDLGFALWIALCMGWSVQHHPHLQIFHNFLYKTKQSHSLIIEFWKHVCFCLIMAMTNTKKMAIMAIVAMLGLPWNVMVAMLAFHSGWWPHLSTMVNFSLRSHF